MKALRWKRWTVPCIVLAALVVFGGCAPPSEHEEGGVAETKPAVHKTTAAPESTETQDAPAARVTGTVKFAGTPPKRTPLQVSEECASHLGGEPLLSEALVVGDQGGLQWAFVYISNPPEGEYPAPEEAAVLDQVGCRYIPHILGLQAGQPLVAANSDPVIHNVRSFPRNNRAFNMGQPVGSNPRTARAASTANEEMGIRIKCDIHPWMTAYLFVVDHPFFGVTGENGSFTIDGLPDGTYDLVVWHEKLGEKVVPITVEGAAASVEVTFEA
jgi:hypothetical protein